jgi:hypothetical protein
VIATGGLSHCPGLLLSRVGTSDTEFDRRLVSLMEAGDHEPLCALTMRDLDESGSHEFLNWMVLVGAAELTDEEREAFVRWGSRRLNELGGSLHLLISIPGLGGH